MIKFNVIPGRSRILFCLVLKDMLFLALIPFIIISVGLLIRAVLKEDKKGIYVFKPLSTVLILLTCFLHPGVNVAYAMFVALGLLFSLAGDVALILPFPQALPAGMLFFFAAHLIYGTGFTRFNGFFPQDILSGAVILSLGLILYAYLYSSLGKMKLPTLLYVMVISFMVWRAISCLFGAAFSPVQVFLITSGAVLFYLADALEAYRRFKHPSPNLRAIHLSFYYVAQLLIALSPGF